MMPPSLRVTASVAHSLQAASRISSSSSPCCSSSSSSGLAVRPRFFHQTPWAPLPRRRSFFTSNVLLQQDGKDAAATESSSSSSSTNSDTAADNNGANGESRKTAADAPAAAKPFNRKRAAPLKKSLHRVAIVAQKGSRWGAPTVTTTDNGSNSGAVGSEGGSSNAGAVGSSSSSSSSVSSSVSSNLSNSDDNSSMIRAVCMANSFDMDMVVQLLTEHGFRVDPDGTGFDVEDVVHARGLVSQGDVFVFASGTVVTWSLPAETIASLSTKTLVPAVESSPAALVADEKEEEDLAFRADPAADEARVGADDGVVVLGTRLPARELTMNKIAISSGLARSTKLGMLENALERYLESTRHIPDQLSRTDSSSSNGHNHTKPTTTTVTDHLGGLSRQVVLQKTGELLTLRGQLNHYNELTDSLPDMLWDSEARLETYYGAVGKALNVNIRIKTLNAKINYAQEVIKAAQEVVSLAERDSSEQHGTRLEWIIIILIAVEVGFELRRLWIEYARGEDETLVELRRVRDALERTTTTTTAQVEARSEAK